jgi:hypothetical protein
MYKKYCFINIDDIFVFKCLQKNEILGSRLLTQR